MDEHISIPDESLLDEIAGTLAISVSSITINQEKIEHCGDALFHTEWEQYQVLLDRYSNSIDAIKNNAKLNVLSNVLSDNGLSPFLLQEILIGIVTTGFSADLPKEMHQLPQVREMLVKNLPVVDRALLGLATLLESGNDEPESTIRHQITNNKETIQHFQKRLSQLASEQGMNADRIGRFESILNQVLWRVTKMSGSALSERCVQLVDKVGGRFGITPQLRHEVCSRLSSITSYDDGDEVMKNMFGTCASEQLLHSDLLNRNNTRQTGCSNYAYSKDSFLESIGAALLDIGDRTVFKKLRTPGGLFLLTGGVVALFLGLIVVIGLWLF
jgi:hypothetical protein